MALTQIQRGLLSNGAVIVPDNLYTTGTATNQTFLRGDGVWAQPSSVDQMTIGNLTVGDTAVINRANITNSALTTSTIGNAIIDRLQVVSSWDYTGPLSISTLTVTSMTVNGDSQINGNEVVRNLTATRVVTAGGGLQINSNATVTNNLTVGQTLVVTSSTIIGGALTVNTNSTVNGSLTVNGNMNVSGSLSGTNLSSNGTSSYIAPIRSFNPNTGDALLPFSTGTAVVGSTYVTETGDVVGDSRVINYCGSGYYPYVPPNGYGQVAPFVKLVPSYVGTPFAVSGNVMEFIPAPLSFYNSYNGYGNRGIEFSNALFATGSSDWAWDVWVHGGYFQNDGNHVESSVPQGVVAYCGNMNSPSDEFYVQIASGKVKVIWDGYNNRYEYETSHSLSSYAWNHITVHSKNGYFYVGINGNMEATNIVNSGGFVGSWDNGNYIFIGGVKNGNKASGNAGQGAYDKQYLGRMSLFRWMKGTPWPTSGTYTVPNSQSYNNFGPGHVALFYDPTTHEVTQRLTGDPVSSKFLDFGSII
jgi:hypothetical protein